MNSFKFIIAFLVVVSTTATAETFIWDAKKAAGAGKIPRVILTNNVIIEYTGVNALSDQSVSAASLDNKQKKALVDNDFAEISSSYPDTGKASVVVLGDSCSGTMCSWKNITVVVPQGSFVKTYPIYDPSKITLTVENGKLVSGHAEGVSAGLDKYGSRRQLTLTFVPNAGFVPSNFKREYAKLIGEHPDKFFSDDVLRKPLVKAVGLETFRDLRHAIGVAGPAALVENRYIVMQGCAPHNCGGNYSFVMIDAFTSHLFWARFDESRTRYFGGTGQVDTLTMQSVLDSNEIFKYTDVELAVTATGKITYRRK